MQNAALIGIDLSQYASVVYNNEQPYLGP